MTLFNRASLFLMGCAMLPFAEPQAQVEDNRATVEIYTLQHRDPAWIRQQIADQLDPRAHVGQIDNKLIVATTVSNAQHLQQRIAELDLAPRRLVVSVDFAHDGITSQAQQSVQALEGEWLSFIAATPFSGASDTAENDFSNSTPSTQNLPTDEPDDSAGIVSTTTGPAEVRLRSDIRQNDAYVTLELAQVDGFSGRHEIALTLGQWYVINPEPDVGNRIAIRVDVLP